MTLKVLLLSVHPEHSNNIFNGSKSVELRRTKPKLEERDIIIVYASSPKKSIVGIVTVKEVVRKPVEQLWLDVEDKAGISYEKFTNYFSGRSTGCGIFLHKRFRCLQTISLEELRQNWDNFHPPQSYRYLKPDEIEIFKEKFDCDVYKICQQSQTFLSSTQSK